MLHSHKVPLNNRISRPAKRHRLSQKSFPSDTPVTTHSATPSPAARMPAANPPRADRHPCQNRGKKPRPSFRIRPSRRHTQDSSVTFPPLSTGGPRGVRLNIGTEGVRLNIGTEGSKAVRATDGRKSALCHPPICVTRQPASHPPARNRPCHAPPCTSRSTPCPRSSAISPRPPTP